MGASAVDHVSDGPGLRLATLLYAALTFVMAWPLTSNLTGSVIWGGPDPNLFMWTLAWDAHALVRQPFSIFDANIYHPERLTLAYSENLIGSAFFAAPVLWLTANPVLALNVVALLSCVLCGAGAYLLGRRAGLSPAGAVVAGIVFAFSPMRFIRIGQLHLATVQWVPFGLAFMHAYLDEGRRRDLRLAIACVTLQALTSGHGVVFLGLGLLLLLAYRVALGEPLAVGRRVRDVGVTGALLLVPAILVFVPYRIVQAEMGLRRTLENWAINPGSFLASPSYLHRYVLSFAPDARINETAGAFLFPGYLPLLLGLTGWFLGRRRLESAARRIDWWSLAATVTTIAAAVAAALGTYVVTTGPLRLRLGGEIVLSIRDPLRPWLAAAACAVAGALLVRRAPFVRDPAGCVTRLAGAFRRWRAARRQDAIAFYATVTALALWLSVGSPLSLWPWVYWLPGLNFIRVPSRFTILALLGLAVLAGAGFDWLRRKLPARAGRTAAWGVSALLLAEFATPLGSEVMPYRVEIPSIDHWLASQPGRFAIAEVPLGDPESAQATEIRHTTYMLHSTAHWQKTVHGYSGMRSDLHERLYAQLLQFPDEPSLDALVRLGVRRVVVHTDLYPSGEWEAVRDRIERASPWLTLEAVSGAGRVYALRVPSIR